MPEFPLYGEGLMTLSLIIAIVCVWFKDARIWIGAYIGTIIIGLATGTLSLIALPSLGLYASLMVIYRQDSVYSLPALIGALLLGVAYGLHILPGFNNFEYVAAHKLSETSAELSIWFNYDKASLGILTLGILFHGRLVRSISEFFEMIQKMAPTLIIGLPIVYIMGMLFGYSAIDWTPALIFIPWAIKNLFYTVLAEEIFFRGLIQRQIRKSLKTENAGLIAVVIAGVLFGVAHFGGGIYYVVLSSVAGCIYGYTYHVTGRIEAPIVTHLLLNAGHFLVFTYPYLA